MTQADLIIIGAGPGGYETAVRAAKRGLQTIIIERGPLGGTCLNAGCIPTKCLCHSAEVLEEVRSAASLGITSTEVKFDLAQTIARKDEVVGKLKTGVEGLMKTPGISLVQGEAHFADNHTLIVGEEQYTAPNIIIATGSITKFLPIEGAHAEGVLTSTELLNLTSLPERLCIIGGGVIGMEFASIFNSFGSKVSVIEFCKEILPNFDRDLAKRLRTSLKRSGIEFHTNAGAKAIHPGTPMVVDYEEKGKMQSIETDVVLMAVGRVANVESLNLSDVGIEFTPRGIKVDEHLQTNVPGIFAIGDVNGLCQLAHAATFQGYSVIDYITEGKGENPTLIPGAVFTVPEAAMVGKTEEQLEKEGISYETHKAQYRANGKALAMETEEGIVKLLTDTEGKILGAHILGAHASDLIHEITVVMNLGGTIHEIARTVHAHPSLSEILLAATE